MLLPPSATKFTTLQFQATPAKLTVDYEINSWNETQSKQHVLYRHKRRKILRTIEENQTRQVGNPTNLTQLRSYKDYLLKSSIKKLSERVLPSPAPKKDLQPPPKPSTSKRFNFQVRSLSRSNHQHKQQPIVVSQFDPNAQNREDLDLNLQFKIENAVKISAKLLPLNEKTVSLPRRKRSAGGRESTRPVSNSQVAILYPFKMENPQSNGISLVSRRLVASRM